VRVRGGGACPSFPVGTVFFFKFRGVKYLNVKNGFSQIVESRALFTPHPPPFLYTLSLKNNIKE
jgi:hypothetical protein